MKHVMAVAACAAAAVVAGCRNMCTQTDVACDIVIYGSSPAAIAVAVQAGRMGASSVIVSPETRIGGLTTGGLGQTDIGNKSAFGGIALEFAAALASSRNSAVQDVPYEELAARLPIVGDTGRALAVNCDGDRP